MYEERTHHWLLHMMEVEAYCYSNLHEKVPQFFAVLIASIVYEKSSRSVTQVEDMRLAKWDVYDAFTYLTLQLIKYLKDPLMISSFSFHLSFHEKQEFLLLLEDNCKQKLG